MAVRRRDFERLGIEHLWSRALSDDLSISRAIRRAGLRTRFVPACMVASYQSMTWVKLWEVADASLSLLVFMRAIVAVWIDWSLVLGGWFVGQFSTDDLGLDCPGTVPT